MFATCLVAPSIVSKSSRADSELVAKKVKQSRRDLVDRERPSRKLHQADLHGEAQPIAMVAFREKARAHKREPRVGPNETRVDGVQ